MFKNDDWWPKVDGYDVPTQPDPITGTQMCRECWNGRHKREGCQIPQCFCDCYRGRNKGLGKAHPPAKGCKEQETLPEAGTIDV